MKILKRQREGALPLSWMTLWQSAWGRTPKWSATPLTKVSTLTSWRWTEDLASLLVSWPSFSAGHRDRSCPSFRSSLLVHWTAPPMFELLPSWKWTKVLLMHHIEWDSWHSPGIIPVLSVIGHSLSLITFWSYGCFYLLSKEAARCRTWVITRFEQLLWFYFTLCIWSIYGTAVIVQHK